MTTSNVHVLLLHGCGVSPATLEPLRAHLAHTHPTHLVAMRGYGERLDERHLPREEAAAELVEELLRAGARELIVIGHSLGTVRMWTLATMLPARITLRGLIGLSPMLGYPQEAREGLMQSVEALEQGADLSEALVARWYGAPYQEQHTTLPAQVRGWLDTINPRALAGEVDDHLASETLSGRLATLTCPVYLRVGALDQATPPELAQAILDVLPQATLEVIPEVGHMLTEEDLDGTLEAVQEHVRRWSSAATS